MSALSSLQLVLDATDAGFKLADLGTTGKKIHGYRYHMVRISDNAVFHYGTAAQVRKALKGDF